MRYLLFAFCVSCMPEKGGVDASIPDICVESLFEQNPNGSCSIPAWTSDAEMARIEGRQYANQKKEVPTFVRNYANTPYGLAFVDSYQQTINKNKHHKRVKIDMGIDEDLKLLVPIWAK